MPQKNSKMTRKAQQMHYKNAFKLIYAIAEKKEKYLKIIQQSSILFGCLVECSSDFQIIHYKKKKYISTHFLAIYG